MTKNKYLEALNELSYPLDDSSCGGCKCGDSDCQDCKKALAVFTLQELIEKYSKILDDVHGYRHETQTYQATIRNLMKHFKVTTIKELISIYYNQSLNFEELHPDMWIWDDYEQEYFKIKEVYIDCNEINRVIPYHTDDRRKFEENRFFLKENKYYEI